MKGPLLGIVAVFCLQLGFTAYTAIDRQSEMLVAVNEVTSGTNPIANIPYISSVANFADSTPDRRKSKRPAGTALVSSKKFMKTPASRPVTFEPIVIALREQPEIKFKTEYPKAMPIVSKPENYPLSPRVAVAPRSEKKSFVSKSVSVLKKPYDWLKALGSRIN